MECYLIIYFFLFCRQLNVEIKKTQKDIFEQLEIVSSLATEAPVHPSFQKRLLDIDDEEIIQSEPNKNEIFFFYSF